MKYYNKVKIISVDIGGTNIKLGVIDSKGKVSDFRRVVIEEKDKTEKGIVRVLTKLLIPWITKKDITKIGVSVPGFIDFELDLIVRSPNFPEWHNFPLRKVLEDIFNRQVLIENDANAFAIGEGWRGAGRGMNNFVGITLGTGVGGGIILDGKIWHGKRGAAGEIGHITVEPTGLKCNCGNQGCLEMYASASAVAREGTELLKKMGLNVSKNAKAREIFKLARKCNKEAIKIFNRVGYYLGIAIADMANVLNIDGVVIGGGMSNAWEFIVPSIKKEIAYRANPLSRKSLKILKSKLGDYSALFGMAKVSLNP